MTLDPHSTDRTLGFEHVYEPAAHPDAPTLLLLHGTGGDEHDLLPLVPLLLPNAGVLSPRGPVSEHGMPRFFRRLALGLFDQEDLARRTEELRRFADTAATTYRFDRANVIAVGLSNGANIAANLILSHGKVLRGAVLFRAMPTREDPPSADATGVQVYMNSGQRDGLITPAQTGALAEQLRVAGASVTLAWDDAGHELTREALAAAAEWLKTMALG
jgi:phospholipase/carboxylesterase